MPNPRMLILCTGNSARSQMAEALMKKYRSEEFSDIISAGLDPHPLNPYAVRVMQEVGLDISSYQSKDVKSYLGQHFTYLITVCSNAEARCPIFPGVIYRLYWPFDDPAAFKGDDEETLKVFRKTRDLIDSRIREWMLEQGMKKIYPKATVSP